MPRDEETDLRCPNCGGRDVRRSYSRTILDTLMLAVRRRPFRCRFCECRFYRPGLSARDAEKVGPPKRQRAQAKKTG